MLHFAAVGMCTQIMLQCEIIRIHCTIVGLHKLVLHSESESESESALYIYSVTAKRLSEFNFIQRGELISLMHLSGVPSVEAGVEPGSVRLPAYSALL